MTQSLSIIFAGTPDFACTSLAAVLASGHRVLAVLAPPDRPAGRGRKVVLSPVKRRARDAGIPVLQPASLKTPDAQEPLRALAPDLMVVVAYGLLLPQAVLDIPRHGCINVHGSILPRWRGAAPVQRAIAAGDTESGVTIMQMNAGLDTGDMLHSVRTPILATDTGGSLHDRLAVLGAKALVQVLDDYPAFLAASQPQDDALATYAHKLSREDAVIDWHQDATTILNRVRAFDPWPVASTQWRGETLRIWSAVRDDSAAGAPPGTITNVGRDGIAVACGVGAVRLTTLQLPGKRAMTVLELLNGHADAFVPGEVLG